MMTLPLQPPLIGGFPARHVAMFDSLVFEWSFYLDSSRNGIDPNSWPLKKTTGDPLVLRQTVCRGIWFGEKTNCTL